MDLPTLARQRARAWCARRTALHLASEKGQTETAMALVAAGADVHSKRNDGCGQARRIAWPWTCDCSRLLRGEGAFCFADCSRGNACSWCGAGGPRCT